MSVDLAEFVELMKVQVNPPGVDLFPDAGDDEWVNRLIGAFWDGRIQGLTALAAYTTDADGIITPQQAGGPDITRDLVQLIIVFAAFRAVVNAATNLKTQFKAQAGPVSYEQQQSANVMRDVLANIKEEKAIILYRLGDEGVIPTYVIDTIQARDLATMDGFSNWVGAGVDWGSRTRFSNF